MTQPELIDEVIDIIKKHTRTEALGRYNCALRKHFPLDYEKCINEIDSLTKQQDNGATD